MLKDLTLTNGRTVADAELASAGKVKSIYKESWRKGISVPFFDNNGNIYLANPDGSEDKVSLDIQNRAYNIIKRITPPGQGRYYNLK